LGLFVLCQQVKVHKVLGKFTWQLLGTIHYMSNAVPAQYRDRFLVNDMAGTASADGIAHGHETRKYPL
jgi:hypothetical protein